MVARSAKIVSNSRRAFFSTLIMLLYFSLQDALSLLTAALQACAGTTRLTYKAWQKDIAKPKLPIILGQILLPVFSAFSV